MRGFITKCGIMLGIGEKDDEIKELMHDLRGVGVDIPTIGQYLQPTKKHEPIDRWVTPDAILSQTTKRSTFAHGAMAIRAAFTRRHQPPTN